MPFALHGYTVMNKLTCLPTNVCIGSSALTHVSYFMVAYATMDPRQNSRNNATKCFRYLVVDVVGAYVDYNMCFSFYRNRPLRLHSSFAVSNRM